MPYRIFNRHCFEFYISRANSTFFNLAIDRTEFESLVNVEEIGSFPELKSSWLQLLEPSDDIPQYFGLLAIQCYAASNMHKDKSNSSSAYQVRLIDILQLDDNNHLQMLFSGFNPSNPVQEKIWYAAKDFLLKTFNQDLDIPLPTINAGRYVQYPKSQALLTTEALRMFTPFFAEEFRMNEILSLEYFESKVVEFLQNVPINNRAKTLFQTNKTRQNCIKQLFNYFNSWKGEVFINPLKKTIKNHKNTSSSIEKKELILAFQHSNITFYIVNPEEESKVEEININDIFDGKIYTPFYRGLFLFTQSEYYRNEFEDSRFLLPSSNSYILIDKYHRPSECQYLEETCENRIELSKKHILYKLQMQEIIKNSILNKFITTAASVRFLGGIRINRKRNYIAGFGPIIQTASDWAIIYQFKRVDYNPKKVTAGEYKVRVANMRDIEFRIIEPQGQSKIISSKSKGWSIDSLSIESSYDIEGGILKSRNVNKGLKPQDPIREWITVNMTQKYSGENILLQALQKTKI